MINTRRFFSITLTALFIAAAVAAPLAAQDSGGKASTPGDSDLMIFKDVYGADGLEMRKKILQDIKDAVAHGNTSDDIYAALEYMSMEGLKNKSAQLQGGYPEIRGSVADQLNSMGTAKATEILIQLCGAEKKDEYYVLQRTIKALGDIGINENDTTIKAIVWKARIYNPPVPNPLVDRVIGTAIDALDKIESKSDGMKNQKDYQDLQDFLKRVSNGHFSKPVRDRAKQILEDMLQRKIQRKQES